MPKVRDIALLTCDPQPDLLDFAVLDRQQLIEPAELVEQIECRGMYGVSAKIPEEVLVLLQHRDLDAGTREQHASEHPGGASAHDNYR